MKAKMKNINTKKVLFWLSSPLWIAFGWPYLLFGYMAWRRRRPETFLCVLGSLFVPIGRNDKGNWAIKFKSPLASALTILLVLVTLQVSVFPTEGQRIAYAERKEARIEEAARKAEMKELERWSARQEATEQAKINEANQRSRRDAELGLALESLRKGSDKSPKWVTESLERQAEGQ